MLKSFDLQTLLDKFNRPGGRYTYYPMHAKWKNNLNIFQWWDSVKKNYDPNIGVDLYIHLPFCETLCTFCGCNILITHKHEEVTSYILALKQEWNSYRNLLGSNIKINSLYLGGGSPNYLTPLELEELLNLFPIDEKSYLSCELDPRKTSNDFLLILKKFNFNTLSFGLQDTTQDVLNNVNRPTNLQSIIEIMTKARELGFQHINLDCIYGLTFQTVDSLKKTVEDFLHFAPDSMAFYPFARVPWQNNSQQVTGVFNDFSPAELHQFFASIDAAVLTNNEFTYLGMGHYIHNKSVLMKAYSEKKLRRNIMGFTASEVSAVLVGLGVSAISSTPDALIQNEKVLETYQFETMKERSPLFKSHARSENEQKLSRIFEELICKNEFPLNPEIEDNPSFEVYLKNNFLIRDELNHKGYVTKVGRYFLKNLCQLFE